MNSMRPQMRLTRDVPGNPSKAGEEKYTNWQIQQIRQIKNSVWSREDFGNLPKPGMSPGNPSKAREEYYKFKIVVGARKILEIFLNPGCPREIPDELREEK